MLSLEECRKIIGKKCQLSDEELEKIRDSLYALADITIEAFLQKKLQEPHTSSTTHPHSAKPLVPSEPPAPLQPITITIAAAMADVLVSGILQTANQLQVQYSQPQTDTAPLSAPARLRFGGRMKISARELAESLGISLRTLRDWQKRRVLPYYKIRHRTLFDVAEVEHALRRFRCIAVGEPRPRKRRMERIQPGG